MKKILYMAVAAIAVLSSCSSDNAILGEDALGATQFTATIEGSDTRTTFNATGKKAEWVAGEWISIGGAYYFANSTGATTTFSPRFQGLAQKTDGVYKAYYPSDLYNPTTKIIKLPASYEYTGQEVYVPDGKEIIYDGHFVMPMYAQSETTSLNFKNLCGVLAITVPRTEGLTMVQSIEISADQQMNGECTIAYQDGVPAITFSSETPTAAEKRVALTIDESKDIESSETFYLPVPAMTNATLTISIKADWNTVYIMGTNSGAVTIERNKIYNIQFAPNNIIDGHEFVRLGGYQWATENVEATGSITPAHKGSAAFGDYFAQDGSTGSTAQEAVKSWGVDWHLPANLQWENLIKKCTWEWKENYPYKGSTVSGYLITGKEEYNEAGNSMFLPAAGYYNNNNEYVNVGNQGVYWAAEDDQNCQFGSNYMSYGKCNGHKFLSIRPCASL